MTSDGKYTAEMLDDARSPAVAEMTREAAVTHLRIKWGLERDAAERLLEAAGDRDISAVPVRRGPSQTRRMYSGIAFMLVSGMGLIFLGSLIDHDGFIWRAMWISLLGGAVTFVEGAWSRYQVSELLGLSAPVVWMSVAIVAAIGFAMTLMLVTTSGPEEASAESLVLWNTQELINNGGNEYRLTGQVLNGHPRWAVKTPKAVITLYNADLKPVGVHEVVLGVTSIYPGQSRSFDVLFAIPEEFDTYMTDFEFDWVK